MEIKMWNLYLLFSLLLLFCRVQETHEFSSEERRKAAEDILNVIINSMPFDSVYSDKRVYIHANELIPENTSLKLKMANRRAIVLNDNELHNIKQYIVLGDFTLNWEDLDSTGVRVQIEIFPDNTLLNLGLKKISGKWVIVGHVIFYDE